MAAPPTRPALRARYDRRRQDIVDAAAGVIARQGFHDTSVQDLVQATGLASGGLYHYIGSKDQLLVDICNELMTPLLSQAREITGAPLSPEEKLRRVVRAWLLHLERHLDHMRVFQQERHVLEAGERWKQVRRSRRTFEELVEQVLADLEDAGVAHFADRRLALLALLGMVNHTPQWYRPGGRFTPEEIADRYCDLLLHGSPPG